MSQIEDFKLDLNLNIYDVMMMSAMIAHARRYGDNQLSDWAGELRDRIASLAGVTLYKEPESPVKAITEEAASLATEATQLLDLVDKAREEGSAAIIQPHKAKSQAKLSTNQGDTTLEDKVSSRPK